MRFDTPLSMMILLSAGLPLTIHALAAADPQPRQDAAKTVSTVVEKSPFDDNLKVDATSSHYIVKSGGIPNHTTAEFPNRWNPNRILKQNYTFYIPRQPKKAAKVASLPMGPIGVAVNGVPFYNPYNAQGRDAVSGMYAEIFDSCCGHPDPMGRYHYHKYPVCLKTPFQDKAGQHSPLIGYAFDGYALYGPKGEGGKPPTDLDECNGHTDNERGYHYHASEKFPYLLGGYRGEVDMRNFDNQGMHRRRPGGHYPMDRPPFPPPFPPPPPGV